VIETVEADVPAWAFEIVPVPVALKNASAVATGITRSASATAAANERLRPIRPALTTRAKTRLIADIPSVLLGHSPASEALVVMAPAPDQY
jgi:hypothetical protein